MLADNGTPYAVCAHVSRGSEHAIARDEFKRMKEAGIGWVRTDFDWSGVERKQGEWNFDQLDETVQWAEEAGIKILPILDYDVRWASPAHEHLDLWRAYVRTIVTRYKDRLRYWEVWNEPNLEGAWRDKPDAGNYTKLLKATYEEVKAVDPDLQVLICGFAGIPWEFIEGIYAAGGSSSFDIMNIHPYRYPARPGPGRLYEDIERLRGIMAANGDAKKPIWITEIGWPTHSDPGQTGAMMKGIIQSGLKAIDPARKTWTVAMLDDPDYARGFTAESTDAAHEMFQPTPIRSIRLDDVAKLDPKETQILVMPPDEAFPGPQFEAIRDYVRRGGVIVLWFGVPLYYEMKPTAEGRWEQLGADEKFRRSLRIGWEAWWTKDGIPKTSKKVVAGDGWDNALPFPEQCPEATRFLNGGALKEGDRFVPLARVEENGYQGAVAGVYVLNSDMKGGVIVSTFRSIRRNVTVDKQGMICPRAYLIALQAGVERTFWYEFQAIEKDPFYNEHHFGMVHPDLTPKPAYTALAALTRLRPSGSKAGEGLWRDEDGTYFPHWTRPDGETVWAIWRGLGTETYELQMTGEVKGTFDHLGQPRGIDLKNGQANVELDEGILYVVGPKGIVLKPAK